MPIPPPDRMLRRRFCTFCSEPSSTRVVAKQSRIKQVGPADTVSVFLLAFRAQERPAAQAGPDHTTFEGELRPLAAGLGDHDQAARVRGVRYVRFTKEFAVRRRRSAFLSACDRRARLGAMDVPGGPPRASQGKQLTHRAAPLPVPLLGTFGARQPVSLPVSRRSQGFPAGCASDRVRGMRVRTGRAGWALSFRKGGVESTRRRRCGTKGSAGHAGPPPPSSSRNNSGCTSLGYRSAAGFATQSHHPRSRGKQDIPQGSMPGGRPW